MVQRLVRRKIASNLRLSRRRLLLASGTGGVSLLGSYALGCSSGRRPTGGGSGQTNAGGQGAGQPKRGGTLNYSGGFAGSYDTWGAGFDPDTILQWGAHSYTLFYQRLVAYSLVNYAIEPEIAQKWEQPSPTEYVFHLQPGVKWHNKPPVSGRPLTAEDVVFSLERVRTGDARFSARSLLALVDKIEAPDKATVRITTKSPDAVTLTKLAAENVAILAKEAVDRDPKLANADSVIGTGPFIMKSAEDKVGGDYVRNPDYWKPGLPYLDGVRTRHFADFLSGWSAYLANQVQVALVPGAEVKNYAASQGTSFTPEWVPDDTTGLIGGPNVTVKPMDDPRVTRALRLLIDHDELIKSWAEVQFGKGGYGSIFPTALSAWDLTDAEYRQQLEWKQPKDDAAKEAISLLAAAGFTKDNPLKFEVVDNNVPQIIPGHQLVQAQWKHWSQGAVDAQIKLVDAGTSTSIRASGTFSYWYSGFSVGVPEPDIWLTSCYHSGASLNFPRYSDPQLDAMIDKQRTIFDQTQRKAVVKEIVRYAVDHWPGTLGANRYFLYAQKPQVQNRKPEYFLNGRQYESVWLNA
ncbi:MAG TPA: ABC transporter substrate-binding protein [Dehalococcoidia bacterium]|nr:ABC transporter substrate-binding protein [Dehalococcoidia bacterium]